MMHDFVLALVFSGIGFCVGMLWDHVHETRQFPKFQPCVFYNEPLRLTEMILKDCTTVWYAWGPYKGHAVDCGYGPDGALVGIKIWDDVRSVEKYMGVDGILSAGFGEHGPEYPL
jgi:hypothetical protein